MSEWKTIDPPGQLLVQSRDRVLANDNRCIRSLICWRLHGTHDRIVKRRDEPFTLLLYHDANTQFSMWRHCLPIVVQHPTHFVSLVDDGDVWPYESDA